MCSPAPSSRVHSGATHAVRCASAAILMSCLFIVVRITVANEHTFYILEHF